MTQKRWQSDGPDLRFSQAHLDVLAGLLRDRLDDLLVEFGVGLRQGRRFYYGPCAIHGGNNSSALNVYHDSEPVGYWRCNTHHCERVFRPTLPGFVRGLLSRQRHGWAQSGDKAVSWDEALGWCCTFVGRGLHELGELCGDAEKAAFARSVATLRRGAVSVNGTNGHVTREQLRRRLVFPADYFVRRGFAPEVLDLFDVGLCVDRGKPLFGRVVAPVYDEYGHFVGATARSVHEKCPECGGHHAQEGSCTSPPEPKWLNSGKFVRDDHLYGWWLNREAVRKSGVAVLVEGPPCVWALRAAGIDVGLALLGAEMSDGQQVMLERSGALTVVCVPDGDEAGRSLAGQLRRQLGRSFRLAFPELPKGAKDLGDLGVEGVRAVVGPLVERYGLKKS